MKKKELFIVFSLLLGLGLFFHGDKINEFPLYTHAWAQADRYAIALGFLENNFNLFYPQTFVLNTQFPHDFLIAGATGITSVDLPIHEYLVAGIMNIIDTRAPWVFRVYELFFSCIGLLYLFRITRLFSIQLLSAIFITFFAALSPVLVYYQAGFIPGITSLSCCFIGLYYFFNNRLNNHSKFELIAFIFLTIAAAGRTPFIIPLLTISGLEILRMLVKKTISLKTCIYLTCSFLIIGSYYFWNIHLRNKYGSLFLNVLKPAQSITEMQDICNDIYIKWRFHYINAIQYGVIAILLFTSLYVLFWKKKSNDNTSINYLKHFIYINFVGSVLFFFAMMQQFTNHDYYFIDTFYLPLFLFLIVLFALIQNEINKLPKYFQISTLLLFTGIMVEQTYATQLEKRITGSWDKTASLVYDYNKLDIKLDSIGIPKNSRILVLDAIAPNIPLIKMRRKGFVVVTTSRENLKNALTFPFNYIAIQDNWFMNDIYPNYPEIIDLLERKVDFGAVSMYTLRKSPVKTSLFEFLNLTMNKPFIQEVCDFESPLKSEWEHTTKSDSLVFQGKFSGFVSRENEYGLTYRTNNTSFLKNKEHTLYFSADIFKPELMPNCQIVVSIDQPGKNSFYREIPLLTTVSINSEWKKSQFTITLPKTENANSSLSVYFWNKGRYNLHVDNMEVSVY